MLEKKNCAELNVLADETSPAFWQNGTKEYKEFNKKECLFWNLISIYLWFIN